MNDERSQERIAIYRACPYKITGEHSPECIATKAEADAEWAAERARYSSLKKSNDDTPS